MDNLIETARSLYTTLDLVLVKTFQNVTVTVDNLFRTMAPKCDAEFNYLFDEQHHKQRQFTDTMTGLLSYVRNKRENYATYNNLYMEKNITLTRLDALYDFEELRAFLNGDLRAVAPAVNGLSSLVHRYEYHAKDVIRWMRAQSSNSYITDQSLYAQEMRTRALALNDSNGEITADSALFSDDVKNADVVWDQFYSQLLAYNRDLEVNRQILKTSQKDSHNYLAEFIRGNQINEAFFR